MKTAAPQDLSELVALSRTFGSDPEYVAGGGGNTSFKSAGRLFIKGSGSSLAEIDAGGFVHLNRARLKALWQRSYPEEPQAREALVTETLLAAREPGEEAKRPSVETPLHDFFPEAYVVHTHPSLVNGLACSRRGREEAAALFGDRLLWVPAVNPGFQLAATVKEEVEAYRKKHGRTPELVILQNHGLVVAGSNPEEVRARSASILEAIRARVAAAPDLSPAPFERERAQELAPALRMHLAGPEGGSFLSFQANRLLLEHLASRDAFREVSTSLMPDHIVYCNHLPLFIPWEKELEAQYRRLEQGVSEYSSRHGFPPRIIALEKLGAWAWGQDPKSARTAMTMFLDALKVLHYSRSFGGPQPLPQAQVDFILNWEAEEHRKKVSAAPARAGRLAGRIALVTGAAQGFGLGISEGLLAEGASVVLADLNGPLVRERASGLGARHGKARVLAVEADVTEEASVRAMVEQAVLGFGGLDLFVSNAGILRAGSLEETDLATFELVNRVNYTAYFLGCRWASRPMKVQHRFAPQRFADIIQINSKSGLAGSNRNFAYAGSKFGAIGLTQSFALELLEHNIKVNAVCPGNMFEGPLWSDPEKGLFVQYLRAGKVPEAKTVADVRRYYEQKVPMGRGCTPADVLKAILYLVEQVYETGQALPVTGGQIMLK